MIDPKRTDSKVTLEDLLRLKRAERPPAGFWLEFEHNLRAKQLAAIVEKRPRWYSLRSLLRWSIPAGAVGAVAATVLSLNLAKVSSVAPGTQAATMAAGPASHVAEVNAQAEPEPTPVMVVQDDSAIRYSEPVTEPAPTSVVQVAAVETVASAQPQVQLASASEQPAAVDASPSSPSYDGSRFAAVLDETPWTAPNFGAFFERAVAQLDENFRPVRRPAVEPLTQVQSPRDARRARLLAFTSSVDSHSPQYTNASNVIRSRERITSHLNDEALYDSIRRLGVMGNGVSIQF